MIKKEFNSDYKKNKIFRLKNNKNKSKQKFIKNSKLLNNGAVKLLNVNALNSKTYVRENYIHNSYLLNDNNYSQSLGISFKKIQIGKSIKFYLRHFQSKNWSKIDFKYMYPYTPSSVNNASILYEKHHLAGSLLIKPIIGGFIAYKNQETGIVTFSLLLSLLEKINSYFSECNEPISLSQIHYYSDCHNFSELLYNRIKPYKTKYNYIFLYKRYSAKDYKKHKRMRKPFRQKLIIDRLYY
jgi:hypothetical protein